MKTSTVAVSQMGDAPMLCAGGTVVCLASGPSLTAEDAAYVRGKADVVIVVNDAWRLAPWADVLYSSDIYWWNYHHGVPAFPGRKFGLSGGDYHKWPEIHVLRNTGEHGLEVTRSGLRTSKNSGGAAINLAVHVGASRVILLGYDMTTTGGRSHFFGDHPRGLRSTSPPTYRVFCDHAQTMAVALRDRGVSVLNCSRSTALTAFPLMRLEDAL